MWGGVFGGRRVGKPVGRRTRGETDVKRTTVAALVAGLLLLALSACSYPGYLNPTDPGARALGGAIIGAGTGAVIGGAAGGWDGAAIGAAVGGAVGAVAGAATTPPPPPAASAPLAYPPPAGYLPPPMR
jgi:hypothetical protein